MNTNNVPFSVVFNQCLCMTAEGKFIVEYDKPQKPEKVIKDPDRNAWPEIRLPFAIIDFDMTRLISNLRWRRILK